MTDPANPASIESLEMERALIEPQLLAAIRRDLIGEGVAINTPFGRKPLIYADYTASGRSLKSIEDYIQQNVLPYYANTHSESSFCGRQSTAFREQARALIRDSLGGNEDWAIIFCGSGATSAINKFIDLLGLRLPLEKSQRELIQNCIADAQRAVVFLSPYEHHSNELPWRESAVDIVCIPLNSHDQLDLNALEDALKTYQHRPLKIGSFSAASNVTGIRSDVDAISRLLHQYQAMACWDYAAAAPYVKINVKNTAASGDNSIDALYLSPHKLIGGPGTPGILAIKRHLLHNDRTPSLPGGGTVSWVSPQHHRYLPHGERREEGGTPAIIEAIRAGLAFKVKTDVGAEKIEQLERGHIRHALERLQQHPHIHLLGNSTVDRLAILSLQIRLHDKNGVQRELHYGLVVALLNDLFGIQARGGCSCAGPYGHYLLGIDAEKSRAFEQLISAGELIFRPGWVRINLNYFLDTETINYLLTALELLATHGWKLLAHYHWDNTANVWKHRSNPQPELSSLSNFSFKAQQPISTAACSENTSSLAESLEKTRQFLVAIEMEKTTGSEIHYDHEKWRGFAIAADFS